MKYRSLPIEKELSNSKEADELKSRYFLETARTRGFQLVTILLRNIEYLAYNALLNGTHMRPDRLLGRMECINEIRRSLIALLPEGQRSEVDFYDDMDEGLVVLDEMAPAGE